MSWPMRNACSVGEARRERNQTAAVDARRHIARAAQASGHDVRHAANRGIAGRAAEGRVVEVECVDVDREHRDAALFPLRDRPIALQQFLQIGQREQTGQAIVANRHRRRLMRPAQRVPRELGVDAQALARVPMMAGEVSDASLRPQAAATPSFRSRTRCRPCGNFAAARGRTLPGSSASRKRCRPSCSRSSDCRKRRLRPSSSADE